MSTTEENKRRTAVFFEAIARGDADAIADTYCDEGRVVTMGNTLISGSRGKDEIRQFAGGVLDEREVKRLRAAIDDVPKSGAVRQRGSVYMVFATWCSCSGRRG